MRRFVPACLPNPLKPPHQPPSFRLARLTAPRAPHLPALPGSGWGFKAQQVLGAVRGKDFRHEKTKKKRGSYRGGAIDPNATFSFKYESDDE